MVTWYYHCRQITKSIILSITPFDQSACEKSFSCCKKKTYPESRCGVIHGLRSTFGKALQGLFELDGCSTVGLIFKILSALSQSILANVVFLISLSMAALKAVRVVFNVSSSSFSCQNRSPILRRWNCSAIMH